MTMYLVYPDQHFEILKAQRGSNLDKGWAPLRVVKEGRWYARTNVERIKDDFWVAQYAWMDEEKEVGP